MEMQLWGMSSAVAAVCELIPCRWRHLRQHISQRCAFLPSFPFRLSIIEDGECQRHRWQTCLLRCWTPKQKTFLEAWPKESSGFFLPLISLEQCGGRKLQVCGGRSQNDNCFVHGFGSFYRLSFLFLLLSCLKDIPNRRLGCLL
jgi:hypothetical protein